MPVGRAVQEETLIPLLSSFFPSFFLSLLMKKFHFFPSSPPCICNSLQASLAVCSRNFWKIFPVYPLCCAWVPRAECGVRFRFALFFRSFFSRRWMPDCLWVPQDPKDDVRIKDWFRVPPLLLPCDNVSAFLVSVSFFFFSGAFLRFNQRPHATTKVVCSSPQWSCLGCLVPHVTHFVGDGGRFFNFPPKFPLPLTDSSHLEPHGSCARLWPCPLTYICPPPFSLPLRRSRLRQFPPLPFRLTSAM